MLFFKKTKNKNILTFLLDPLVVFIYMPYPLDEFFPKILHEFRVGFILDRDEIVHELVHAEEG